MNILTYWLDNLMPNKKGCKKPDQKQITKCKSCFKHYTKFMMIQVNTHLDLYKCIRCYNNGRTIYGKENDIYKLLS